MLSQNDPGDTKMLQMTSGLHAAPRNSAGSRGRLRVLPCLGLLPEGARGPWGPGGSHKIIDSGTGLPTQISFRVPLKSLMCPLPLIQFVLKQDRRHSLHKRFEWDPKPASESNFLCKPPFSDVFPLGPQGPRAPRGSPSRHQRALSWALGPLRTFYSVS